MRVLIVTQHSMGDELARVAEDESHQVVQLEKPHSATAVAARIRSAQWDLVLIDSLENVLSGDVVDACDSRGIILVGIVFDDDGQSIARQLGVDAVVSPWQGWADVLRASKSNSTDPVPLASQKALTPTDRPIITVWGPTGGPGRSTVALNVAVRLAQTTPRVLLIDADTYGGALAIRLGVFDEAPGIARACRLATTGALTLESFESLVHQVHGRGWKLDVMTGLVGSSRWPEISSDRLEKVVSVARSLYDVVVIDVGFSLQTDEEISSDLLAPRRNGATLTAMRLATQIIAVSGADAVGLSRFIRLWSQLGEIVPETDVTVVVNHVIPRRDGSAVQDEIAAAFSRFAGIRELVLVPRSDDVIARAEIKGQPPCVLEPHSPFSMAIAEIARRAGTGDVSGVSSKPEKRWQFRLLG